MIELLYKIIHYEPSPVHKDNVTRSLYFTCSLISVLPGALVYLIYMKIGNKNTSVEFLFYAVELAIVGSSYYFIVSRKSKMFIESEIGWHYLKFGRFINLLKPLILLMAFGVVIILGRVMFVLLK